MILSFVVPCYNVREYVEDCLLSLLKIVETCDCEIIVVDDGSTDSTYVELLRWEEKFPNGRYNIIVQENKGLSGARNTGIMHAKGEYIFLLDSDDYLNIDSFPAFLDELNKHSPDAIFFNYYWLAGPNWYWEAGYLSLPPKTLLKDKAVIFECLYRDRQFYSWAKVFRRAAYHEINFPEGRNYEDIATVPQLINKIETLYYLPVPMVFYRQRNNSIMKIKSLKNILDLSCSVKDDAHEFVTEGERYYRVEFYLYVYLWSMIDLSASVLSEDMKKEALQKLRLNFYSSINQDDIKFFIKASFARHQYKMTLKALTSYYAGRFYWFIIKRKYK